MSHKKAKLLRKMMRGGAVDVFDAIVSDNVGREQEIRMRRLESIYGSAYDAACERSRQVLLGELVAGKKTVEQFDEEMDVIFGSLKFDAEARAITFFEYTGKELKLHALMFD